MLYQIRSPVLVIGTLRTLIYYVQQTTFMYTSGFYNCDGFCSVINHACSISGHGISEAPRVRLHAADPLLPLLQVIIEAVFEETQSHESLSTVSGFSISSTF